VQPGITIPDGAQSVTIGADGTVSACSWPARPADPDRHVQLTDFINPAGLQPRGENLLVEPAPAARPAGTPGLNGLGLLQQGSLESSNVNVVEELVNMIETQRAYEMNSKAISTTDQMLEYLTTTCEPGHDRAARPSAASCLLLAALAAPPAALSCAGPPSGFEPLPRPRTAQRRPPTARSTRPARHPAVREPGGAQRRRHLTIQLVERTRPEELQHQRRRRTRTWHCRRRPWPGARSPSAAGDSELGSRERAAASGSGLSSQSNRLDGTSP
jgi:hypothetical protein